MIQTKIAQLEIASSVNDSDYLVIDNTEVTKRATISTLSNKLSSTFNIDQLSNSANWNSTYTIVGANSANWNNTYTTFQSNSSLLGYNTQYTLTNSLCEISTKNRFDDLETLNVKEYGAKGDGVTDDWLAIQRTIYAASIRPDIVGATWKNPLSVTEEDTVTSSSSAGGQSAVITRPMIWGAQGVKTVYLPKGDYLISKPLIITHGTNIRGEGGSKSTLLLSPNSTCSFIESMNLALARMYKFPLGRVFDQWNAHACIDNIELRRNKPGLSVPPLSNPNGKDWFPVFTTTLSGIAGSNILSAAPYTGNRLASTYDYPIKMLHEFGTPDETEYNIISITTREVVLDKPLTTSTPLSGSTYLTGLPLLKGIFTSGGENYTIDDVLIHIPSNSTSTSFSSLSNNSGVGIFVLGGSPSPTIKDCMTNYCGVGFWIENGPALLLKPSGDLNGVFIRSGMLLFSVPTIIAPKIEQHWSDIFEFGTRAGSDVNNFSIIGGTINSTETYPNNGETAVILARSQAGSRNDANIVVESLRAFSRNYFYVRCKHIFDSTNISLSALNIVKTASSWGNTYTNQLGSYPIKFHWDGSRDIMSRMEQLTLSFPTLSSVHLGPFADNTAAASGGVSIGSIYRKTDGTLVWRNA